MDKMTKRLLPSFLVALFAAASVMGQQSPAYERVVIPFHNPETLGAYNTRWLLRAWVFNSADERVTLAHGRPLCTIMCPGGRPSIAPHNFEPIPRHPEGETPAGMILFTDAGFGKYLTFLVRLYRTDDAGEHFVLEMPVIREPDFRTEPIELLKVPNDPARRVMIRIYELSAARGTAAWIRVFDESRRLLAERFAPLDRGINNPRPDLPEYTGWAQFALTDLISPLLPPQEVRIEIQSDQALQLWAFASITDNATQAITLVTPQ